MLYQGMAYQGHALLEAYFTRGMPLLRHGLLGARRIIVLGHALLGDASLGHASSGHASSGHASIRACLYQGMPHQGMPYYGHTLPCPI